MPHSLSFPLWTNNKAVSQLDIKNELSKILTSIKVADNYDTPSGSEVSSPREMNFKFSTRVQKYRKLISAKDQEKMLAHQSEQDYIYYYDKTEIKNLSKDFIEKEMRGMDYKFEPDDDEPPFREWAMEERAKYKASLDPAKEENFPRLLPLDFDRKSSIVVGAFDDVKFDRSNLNKGQTLKKLGGYLYGPFNRIPSADKFTKDESKYAIPKTMMDRYEKESRKHKIRKRTIRRARLFAMGLPMPPSSEYSTDEEMEEVKTLALIRTPYFIIPTVRTQTKKKADRFKNKYLRRDGLRRITMLLYDRTLAKRQQKDRRIEMLSKDPFMMAGKTRMKKIISKVRQALIFKPTAVKEKYLKFIEAQYLRQKKLYDEKYKKTKKCITFEEFKEQEKKAVDDECAKEISPRLDKNRPISEIRPAAMETTTLKDFNKSSKPDPLFRRFKMHRSSRTDDLMGPFYTDPYLMDKFRTPSKCKLFSWFTRILATEKEKKGFYE